MRLLTCLIICYQRKLEMLKFPKLTLHLVYQFVSFYILFIVVGAEEIKDGSVNVRSRDDPNVKGKGEVKKLDDVIATLHRFRNEKSLTSFI